MLEINFNPFPVLNSERLLFREISENDADTIFQLRSDPVSMEFLDRAPLKAKEEALALIKKMKEDISNNNGIVWALALKEEPAKSIGTISFWRIEKENHRAEIGYMLLPVYFNKGYMTEAINRVNEYAFTKMNLHSIEANINPANAASAAILLKTGFVKEGHFKENYFFDGKFIDSAIFSLLKTTYLQSK